LVFVALAATVANAQISERRGCLRNIPADVAKTRGTLGYPSQDWDPERIYRQAVVLISFSDRDFLMADPAAYYQRLFNERGYNEGYGQGCVADYFRDQSGGRFNLQFDIYGPFKVSVKAKASSKDNYGDAAMKEAMDKLKELADTTDADFSVYDWDDDQEVDQMVFVAAGYSGNQKTGYIWPNTSYAYMKAPGDLTIGMSSISCELWRDDSRCGIGTICHEFAHCLSLPDIYPTNNSDFSVVDEWDLMDGGNYTNKGWCPPNFSATEKMHLGWGDPIELTDVTTLDGIKAVSEGGETYIIRNSGNPNEFYILEHRRQTKWDYGIPGEGLVIFHVDYDREVWSSNTVNSSSSHYRYNLFHADRKTYVDWDPNNNGRDMSKYTEPQWMRNRYLSTSVYPYVDSLWVNDRLTNDSDPAATLYNANAEGVYLMSKPVTNIRKSLDGTISCDVIYPPSAIKAIKNQGGSLHDSWYDLQGRRLSGKPWQKGLYIHNGRKESIR
jgi:M6 family metalloprotease-like protein